MKGAEMKTDAELQAVAEAGATWCRTPDAPDAKKALPHIPSSNYADAWIIGAWCQYWTGSAPHAIRSSRGHSMRIMDRNRSEVIVRITDPHDHRRGVEQLT